MTTFLTVAAGILFGLILFVFIGIWWLKRKFAGLGKILGAAISQLGTVTPLRISLETAEDGVWTKAKLVNKISQELEELGFQQAGDFEVPEMPDLAALRGFSHSSEGSFAVVYEHGEAGVFADIFRDFDGGQHFTVSTAPESGMDRPPNAPLSRMDIDFKKTGSVRALYEFFQAETAGLSVTASPKTDFASRFVNAYAEEMDWRIERGGVSEAEIFQIAAVNGQETPTPEAIELVKNMWTTQIDEFVQEQALQQWLKGADLSASEWELKRDRVIVVSEQSDREDRIGELAYHMAAATADEDDDDAWDRAFEAAEKRLHDLFDHGSVRAAFLAAQSLLPERARYERLGQITDPFPTEIYLAPEGAEACY